MSFITFQLNPIPSTPTKAPRNSKVPRTPRAYPTPRASYTPMVAPQAPIDALPTHSMTPLHKFMPSPRFRNPNTSQTGQGTHSMVQSMAYNNQPAQWMAPTTPIESITSQNDVDAHIAIPTTPVKPSAMPGGNPWPSPSSSTHSPQGNTSSTQLCINEDALGQYIGSCVPPEGPQGYMSDDNIWNEEFRVGGPQLCALPARTTLFDEGSHHYSLVWDGDFLNRVYRMAHRFNIEPIEAMLVTRQSEWGMMPAPIITVLIFANRKSMDDSWVQCAQLIRKYLTTQILEPNISVEIADPRAFPWKGPDSALAMSPP